MDSSHTAGTRVYKQTANAVCIATRMCTNRWLTDATSLMLDTAFTGDSAYDASTMRSYRDFAPLSGLEARTSRKQRCEQGV